MKSLFKKIYEKYINPAPKTKKYVSCQLIEHAFMFDQNNCLRVCSSINNEGGGRPLIQRGYHGETIDWKKVFKIKREHRKLQEQGQTIPECVGCEFLHEGNWDTKDYIDELLITHWIDCNSNCSYCPVVNDDLLKKSTEFYNIVPALKDAIRKKVIRKDALINLAGGEATIHPEFEELVTLFIKNKFTNVVLNTSAIKYSQAVYEGIKTGNFKIVVSVDAGTKETHEKVKRVNSYDQVWDNLTKYAEAQKLASKTDLVRTKYIVVPGKNDTKEEVDAFIEKNMKADIKAIAINVEIYWYQENFEKENKNLKEFLEYMIEQAKSKDINYKLYPQAIWIIQKNT